MSRDRKEYEGLLSESKAADAKHAKVAKKIEDFRKYMHTGSTFSPSLGPIDKASAGSLNFFSFSKRDDFKLNQNYIKKVAAKVKELVKLKPDPDEVKQIKDILGEYKETFDKIGRKDLKIEEKSGADRKLTGAEVQTLMDQVDAISKESGLDNRLIETRPRSGRGYGS